MNDRITLDRYDLGGCGVRHDGPVPDDLSPEAGILAFWITRQSRLYGDLLRVVAHAPRRPRPGPPTPAGNAQT